MTTKELISKIDLPFTLNVTIDGREIKDIVYKDSSIDLLSTITIQKGDLFQCIKTVYMKDDGAIAYIEGKIYHSQQDGCITDEFGEINHHWDGVSYFDEHFQRFQ